MIHYREISEVLAETKNILGNSDFFDIEEKIRNDILRKIYFLIARHPDILENTNFLKEIDVFKSLKKEIDNLFKDKTKYIKEDRKEEEKNNISEETRKLYRYYIIGLTGQKDKKIYEGSFKFIVESVIDYYIKDLGVNISRERFIKLVDEGRIDLNKKIENVAKKKVKNNILAFCLEGNDVINSLFELVYNNKNLGNNYSLDDESKNTFGAKIMFFKNKVEKLLENNNIEGEIKIYLKNILKNIISFKQNFLKKNPDKDILNGLLQEMKENISKMDEFN